MPENVAAEESPITQLEFEHALRGMPMKKSPGPDDITIKMLVAAGDIGITELTKLANMMHVQGSFPSELNKYIFIALPKLNGTLKCEKHRTISLMSHVAKLMLRIAINRIRGRTLHEIAPEQYGFTPDKGTEQEMSSLYYGCLGKGLLRNRNMSMCVLLTTVRRLIR